MTGADVDRVAPWVAAATVMAVGVAVGTAALRSDLPGSPGPVVVAVDVAAGWSFATVGALLWRRYPDSRIGALTIGVGLASFLPDLRWLATPMTWTLGWLLTDVHLVALAGLVVAFPSGRLGRLHRLFVGAVAVYFVALAVAGHLFQVPVPGCGSCPRSLLLVRTDPALNERIWEVGQVGNLVVVGVLIGLIVHRWTTASPPARRALAPVVWALWPIGLTLAAASLERLIGAGPGVAQAVLIAERAALFVFPGALVAGMLRSRLDHARVGDLTRSLDTVMTAGELERRIGTALGDPSARLVYRSDDLDALIDAAGRTVEPTPAQRVTAVTRDGEPLGAVLHDPQIDPSLVEAVASTAGLALHNERLRAELRRQLVDTAASRTRIAEATVAERQRIERDLHDGAQQRLLALGALLARIRASTDGQADTLLAEAIDEVRSTIDELRELARGVHPAILTDRGLAAALQALAERSPVPVQLDVTTARYRAGAEAAVYYVAAEALTNATRHAAANLVHIELRRIDDTLRIRVTDDGVGGADPGGGTGLQGLADRTAAHGGRLRVTSPPGEGTTVEGIVPCA